LFADGGDVAADAEPGFGSGGGAVAAGDLELGLDRSEVALGAAVGERDGQVVGEAQDLGLAVAEPFEQVAGLGLLAPVGSAVLGQADLDCVPAQPQQFGGQLGCDLVQALVAGGACGLGQ
jgi:hypothetical protein